MSYLSVDMEKDMEEKIFQEFYCGECRGYIRVRLNMNYDRIVEIICPNCKHQHKRCIVKGVILENGRENGSIKEEVVPPISAYHKEAITSKMKDNTFYKRDGVIIDDPGQGFLRDRWLELYG